MDNGPHWNKYETHQRTHGEMVAPTMCLCGAALNYLYITPSQIEQSNALTTQVTDIAFSRGKLMNRFNNMELPEFYEAAIVHVSTQKFQSNDQ